MIMENTNIKKKFKGLEIAMDNIRLEEQLIPKGFDISNMPYKPLDYFKKYGFKVSSLFPALYYKYNGIQSDKYIPASLYFYYITPYLVNMNLSLAYMDKNMYSRLFPKVRQPHTIVHNMNGRFYLPSGMEMQMEDCLKLLHELERFIIKPAIESGRGRDVKMINGHLFQPEIKEILSFYQSNYIIQDVVCQHEVMARLNSTSLNTCRLYTYRRVGTQEYILLGAAVRFGGNGSYRDNACTGGGLCKIYDSGEIDDTIYRFSSFDKGSLKEQKGLAHQCVPNYGKVIETCMSLHKSLPYLDLIGWDMAIGEDGEPVLIELNQYPDCEFIQIFNGPMFGEYTDELLERIQHHRTEIIAVAKRSFENGPKQYDYNFEIGKQYSI